jgi:hypothetical protein
MGVSVCGVRDVRTCVCQRCGQQGRTKLTTRAGCVYVNADAFCVIMHAGPRWRRGRRPSTACTRLCLRARAQAAPPPSRWTPFTLTTVRAPPTHTVTDIHTCMCTHCILPRRSGVPVGALAVGGLGWGMSRLVAVMGVCGLCLSDGRRARAAGQWCSGTVPSRQRSTRLSCWWRRGPSWHTRT